MRLFLKRDDLLHPQVSGNKWRKLKYNLLEARRLGHHTLLTYGGTYSNHLYAVAAAGKEGGFQTIGVVRGEDHQTRDTPTLRFVREQGMHLHFVTRQAYRAKTSRTFQDALIGQFGPFYAIPEGGSNALAVRGVAELYSELESQLGERPDVLTAPVGTGGTLAGLVASAPVGTQVLGFSALKGGAFLAGEVERLLNETGRPVPPPSARFQIYTEYHFGGYARTTPGLLAFIRVFERQTGVRIEQVYTGKMLYGIFDLARRGVFPEGTKLIALHTGGMQGRSPVLDTVFN